MPEPFAPLPPPPYYAVIFTSTRRADADARAYEVTAARMVELAREQPGYLGYESVHDADGVGITVAYWRDEEAIAAWKAHAEHALAQQAGRNEWYAGYTVRVAKVERAYGWGDTLHEPG